MNLGLFLFSNRSYTPIPFVIALLYQSEQTKLFLLYGLMLIIIGEIIRVYAVKYAGAPTRTRKVGAPSLCTSGPYARTRNPLYLANMIIYLGIVFFSGGPYMWQLFIIVMLFFSFQYSLIVSLEEEKLLELFGAKYNEYRQNVPILFPRLTPWSGNDNKIPLSIKQTLITEKRTLQNLFLITLIIFGKSILIH